jgi:hypothetical protein
MALAGQPVRLPIVIGMIRLSFVIISLSIVIISLPIVVISLSIVIIREGG